jgi:CcmD family protein
MFTRSFEMLFYTYTIIWLIIFLYVVFVSYRTTKLEKKLDQLETKLKQQ